MFEGREGELERAAHRIAWRGLYSRRALVVAAAGGAVAVAVLVALLASGGASQASVAPNSVAALNPSYRLERDDAPAAAISTGTGADFFSARIGCQLYQPVYGMDLAHLCLRSKP